jgi:hypothetical protein
MREAGSGIVVAGVGAGADADPIPELEARESASRDGRCLAEIPTVRSHRLTNTRNERRRPVSTL